MNNICTIKMIGFPIDDNQVKNNKIINHIYLKKLVKVIC